MEREELGEVTTWRKSARSNSDASNCVEVSLSEDSVRVRDSKGKPTVLLSFPPSEWTEFIACLKRDELPF